MNAQLVKASDVKVGDRIAIPQHGFRVVLDVTESTFGLDEQPCIRIVYALGATQGRGKNPDGSKGVQTFVQPETGLRPLRHDELVAIAAREIPALRGATERKERS